MKKLFYFLLLGVVLISACDKAEDKSDDNIPMDSFVGYYHMIGTLEIYNSGWPPNITNIDDTILISKLNDSTLLFGNNISQFSYSNPQPDSFYLFFYTNNWTNSASLKFHKPYSDDSVFYSFSESGGTGGATIKELQGVKIY